jgi:uncharacterized protein YjeT (DUF2065 family)
MTGRIHRLAPSSARLLVGLYPDAWRKRYRTEVVALVEEDPPRLRGLTSLVIGAADAHLRPKGKWSVTSPQTRMRLSLGAIFCCWIALSLNGIGFQKDTEDAGFATAGEHHPLLAIAHGAVVAGAALGALAIAVGGLPLVWQALYQTYTRRDRRLALLLLSPALALAAFAALTWLLVTISPVRHDGFPPGFVLSVQAPWRIGGVLCAVMCALAPRLVMARVELGAAPLRRASLTTAALAIAMGAVTLGLTVYACALPLQAPSLAAESTAPVGAGTGAMLALYAAAAWIASALGLVASRRALGAALRRS